MVSMRILIAWSSRLLLAEPFVQDVEMDCHILSVTPNSGDCDIHSQTRSKRHVSWFWDLLGIRLDFRMATKIGALESTG